MKRQSRFIERCPSYIIYPIFFLLLAMSSPQSFSAANNSSDWITLLTIKSMISDPSNALASWQHYNATLHFCSWRGVTCGRRDPYRVTSLFLNSLDLAGSLPPHIANLTFLTSLNLSHNSFSGSIPAELGRLSRLTHLNLSVNSLDGDIPESLTRCSNLQIMNLRSNHLSGNIPLDIGSLSHLRVLNLRDNNLHGTIPPSLGNISFLSEIYLYDNNLVGSIPESMGKLSALEILEIDDNRLSGNIPSSLFNLSSIKLMGLANNSLTGTLPMNMFNTLPKLQGLHLFMNKLEGSIPLSLPNATNMDDFEIGTNFFRGTIPPNLGNLRKLNTIELSYNQLEAKEPSDWEFLTSLANCSYLETFNIEANNLGSVLPSSVANLSSTLQIMSMADNQLSGSIPEGIGNLGNLTVLSLYHNHLTGSIPDAVGNLNKLHYLLLSENRLMGLIPNTIGNLTQLNILDLHRNNLNGSIPPSLGKCRSLQAVDLSHNMLTGAIPKDLLMLPSLSQYLHLSHNLLTGYLPVEVGQLTNLNSLSISGNKLSGEIPTTLAGCQSLEYLYMDHNLFNGPIPDSFRKLKGLRVLDLSQNNLSGKVPEYMGSMGGLQILNLSYNHLEGEVPDEGTFTNATILTVLGNKNLCGGSPKLHLPSCHTKIPKERHRPLVIKVIIPVLGASFCTLIFFLVIFYTRHCLKDQRKIYPSTSFKEGNLKKVSYAELLKATDGFSTSNLIGVGGVGSVYRGSLKFYESTTVAVKVFNLQYDGASKSFFTECDILKNIRHRNLVKILTSCSGVDSSGNDFKALVLEFMHNGSLEKWLHPAAPGHFEFRPLSLDERLNIAIDVASALEYLHHHGQTPIVHCDLKPSNILLDADMCAYVGDFGLARLLWDKVHEANEHQIISSGIKGTIGYVAPEYGMGSQVSTYGDVYSYGILLLELFTGRRPIDEIFKDGLCLSNYVDTAFPESVNDIVDSRLHLYENDLGTRDYNQNEDDRLEKHKCLVSLMRLGVSCSKQEPRERMEMKDITKELHALKDALLKSKTMKIRFGESSRQE